jgi:hypothetical protein
LMNSNLIRLGGLAAMVAGVLYASQTYWLQWPLVRTGAEGHFGAFLITVVGFLALLALGVVAIVALNAQKGRRYGLIAVLASLAIAAGAAAILAGMSMGVDTPASSNLSALILIVGALIVTLGLVALGIVTISARVLPWWCGVALIASPIFALLGPLGGGVPLVLVGYATFRASTRQTERPSRVQ